VLAQRNSRPTGLRRRLAAAGDKGRPGLFGLFDVAHGSFDLFSGHLRAEISRIQQWIVDGQIFGGRREFVEELIFDVFVDKES